MRLQNNHSTGAVLLLIFATPNDFWSTSLSGSDTYSFVAYSLRQHWAGRAGSFKNNPGGP